MKKAKSSKKSATSFVSGMALATGSFFHRNAEPAASAVPLTGAFEEIKEVEEFKEVASLIASRSAKTIRQASPAA